MRSPATPASPSSSRAATSTPQKLASAISTETTAATLQRRFDQLTDPAAHALITDIRQQRGTEAALIAAELLARRRAERVSTAGA